MKLGIAPARGRDQSWAVDDQIVTRFGALSKSRAAAVRLALDTAVTSPALVPMNSAYLRMTLIAEILDADSPPPEPPSHRWYELMVECFGDNEVGHQNSTVWAATGSGKSHNALLAYLAALGETPEREELVIHDLLVAAGGFLVADSITMDDQIERWNLAGRESSLADDLLAAAARAGAVGMDLLEYAESRTWRDLLSPDRLNSPTHVLEPSVNRSFTFHGPAVSEFTEHNESSVTDDLDYIVVMVDSVGASHRRDLTARALSELRGAATCSESSSRASAVVVSAADGRQSNPLPLTSVGNVGVDTDRTDDGSIENTLRQVAQLVETLSQSVDRVSTIDASITRPLGGQRNLITGIDLATKKYDPVLLIVLGGECEATAPLGRDGVIGMDQPPQALVDGLRGHGLLPALQGVSLVFLWATPSLEPRVGAYWLAICVAGGASSCEFDFVSPQRRSSDLRYRHRNPPNLDATAGFQSRHIQSNPSLEELQLVRSTIEEFSRKKALSYCLAEERRTRRALGLVVPTVAVIMVGMIAVGLVAVLGPPAGSAILALFLLLGSAIVGLATRFIAATIAGQDIDRAADEVSSPNSHTH